MPEHFIPVIWTRSPFFTSLFEVVSKNSLIFKDFRTRVPKIKSIFDFVSSNKTVHSTVKLPDKKIEGRPTGRLSIYQNA